MFSGTPCRFNVKKNNLSDRRPIRNLDMLHRRLIYPIGDQHAWSETHQRPTCPIVDRHAWLEKHRRPQHASLVTHLKPTCPIRDPSETNMPRRGPIWNQHAPSETHWIPTCLLVSNESCRGLQWVSNQACRSPVVFQSGMSVSDQACRGLCWSMSRSPIRHHEVYDVSLIGFGWVSDNNNISWTLFKISYFLVI